MKLSRKTLLKSLLGGLLINPFRSSAQPPRTAVAEFLESHRRSKDYTLKVYDQMPDEHKNFKPLPEMLTFQRHFTHCIDFVSGQLSVRLGIKNPFEHLLMDELTPAQARAEIVKCYDWVEKIVKEATPQQLAKTGGFAGDQVDLLRLLYICENHLIHHRGTVMVYLRHKGIVPEGYVGW